MAAIPPVSEITTLLNDGTVSNIDQTSENGALSSYGTSEEEESAHKYDADFDTTWKLEAKLLSKYSAPLIVTYMLQYSYSVVGVLVTGRLGTNELGAISLATMTSNVTGLCVYEGLASCLDTLTSQAYGAGRKKMVGLHVQRMIALMLVCTIPIGVIWFCSPWILERIVPEKELARLAGGFLRIYILGMPGYGTFEAAKRFTQAQGDFTASLVPVLVCAPLNLLWNWLFVFRLNLGFQGVALAQVVSNTLQPIVLFLYITFSATWTLECWPGFSLERLFQNWGTMITLAVPGIVMVLSEWLAFDILTFSSSYLSTAHLAAQSVMMTVAITIYHIPMPVSVAVATRMGNLIGYGALKAAREAWKFYYFVAFCIGLMDIILLTSLRHVIATIFSTDPAVKAILVNTIPIVAAAQMFDACSIISNGMLRGLGRQRIGGWVNFCAYYLFGIPLSLTLTFGPPKLQLLGLWIGPLLGLGVVSSILFFYMKWTDWRKCVEDAKARSE